ncbi:MAG: hypothetical protein EHM14_11135 [Methanothrix sp.]|nr:MAG: hypothetical protein EHM14_11135 [Methanothrix sp.]
MRSIMMIVIALTLMTALGGMAQAAGFEITGAVGESIEVTAPPNTSLTLPIGDGSWQHVGQVGLNTNSDSWVVYMGSDKDGRMASKSVPEDTLSHAMQASAAADGANPQEFAESSFFIIKQGYASSNTPIDLYLLQPIAYSDIPHDDYSTNITITTMIL